MAVVTTKGQPAASRPTARSTQSSKSTRTSRAAPPTRRGPSHAAKPANRSTSRASTTRRPATPANDGIWRTHAADLWGLALIVLGVLLGLAIYGSAGGPVGSGANHGLGYLIGWARYTVPPICVAAGALLIFSRRRPEPARTVLGAVLGLVAVSGLADLAGGAPHFGAPADELRSAGGVLGLAVGRGLSSGVGTAGASVIFVALALVAVVLATGVGLGALGRGVVGAVSAVARTVSSWWDGGRFESAPTAPPVPLATTVVPPEAATVPTPARPPVVEEEPAPREVLDIPVDDVVEPPAEKPVPLVAPRADRVPVVGEWRLPPMRLLKRSKEQRQDLRQLDVAGEALVAALLAHGVETRLVGRTVGPTVTRFELELGAGVKVARVTSLSKDIAYAMASPDVRILAPIPGRSAIGVEVPNRTRQLVSLGDILTSPEADAATHPLEVALGRDIAGRAVLVNLAEMPHVLISGATGAGKSSCINSLITSILMRATPDQVRMILVDPKRVELGQYNDLPHLLTPVVVDPKKAANALAWAVKEMERRYDLLAEYGVRDITGYNEAYDRGDLGPIGGPSVAAQAAQVAARAKAKAKAAAEAEGEEGGPTTAEVEVVEPEVVDDGRQPERLPFVLVVVDELNDLMMVAARDVEESVVRIAQMARAVGIHLVLATQRPSVDVITGVIKANVPSRMAFSVSSLADSRVILDQPGAERLIGKGDMLILTASSNIPRRLQGPWVSEEEVREAVAFWRRQGRTPEPVVGIDAVAEGGGGLSGGGNDDDDELLQAAMDLVVRSQLGSTSMLQRKLRVGFARAGRLMDLLEQRGVVGPSEGSKARAVLMTVDELESRPE